LAVSGTSTPTPYSTKKRNPVAPEWHFEQLGETASSSSQCRAASLAPLKCPGASRSAALMSTGIEITPLRSVIASCRSLMM
jgi:hypothetical protein